MKFMYQVPRPRRWRSEKPRGLLRCFVRKHVYSWLGINKTEQNDIFKEIGVQRLQALAVVVQQYVLDWKVDNLELVKLQTEDPFVYNEEGAGSSSSSIYIYSRPFIAGCQINRNSEWTLLLKSHHVINRAYYFSVVLFLNRIIHGDRNKPIQVSFSLHVVNQDDGQIVFSRHMTNVAFKPTPTNEEALGRGFDDFIPFYMVTNDARIFSSESALHLRLDLYLSSEKPSRIQAVAPIRFSSQPSHSKMMSLFAAEQHVTSHPSRSVEVVAENRSFHIDPSYLRRFPSLERLLKEDEYAGNLGIVVLDGVSDSAVHAMLRYLVGNHIVFYTSMEEATNVLKLAYRFKVPELAHDMWLNVLQLTDLRNLAAVAVCATDLEAPNFVRNHIRLLLFTFLAQLKTHDSFLEWTTDRPLSFLSFFLDVSNLEDERSGVLEQDDRRNYGETFHVRYNQLLQATRYSDGEVDTLTASNPGQTATLDASPYHFDEKCACEACQMTRRTCVERLHVDYLARIEGGLKRFSTPSWDLASAGMFSSS